MSVKNYHIDFKLNEKSFDSVESLLSFSNTISKDAFSFLENWFDDSDFILIHTSGSTGKPKSIKIKKEHMLNSAMATGIYFDLKSKTNALLCLPIAYIAGKMMLVRSLFLGWHLDILEPKSNPFVDIVKLYDFSAMIPLQLFNSIDNLFKIKIIIVGAAAISNELKTRILDLPTKIYATYGMTETITHIAVKALNKASGLTIDNDLYQALPNVKLSKDHRNCLIIDAPEVSDEILITNDIVDLISDDKFKWLGRFDNMINSGGVKLIPEQIEAKLQSIISNRFFICSFNDDKLGEKLVLVVEGDKNKNDPKNFFDKISKLHSIDKYEIPKEIYFVERFVMTETKKIQRKKTLDLIFT